MVIIYRLSALRLTVSQLTQSSFTCKSDVCHERILVRDDKWCDGITAALQRMDNYFFSQQAPLITWPVNYFIQMIYVKWFMNNIFDSQKFFSGVVVFLPDRRRTPATHPHNSLMWVVTPRGCFWLCCMSGHLPANPWKAFFTAYERIWISRCRTDWFAGCFEFTCKGTEREVSSNNDSVLSPSVEMFSLTVFYTVYVGSRRRS